jgi:two-component system, NarL family, sensor histidine kinase DesK
MGRNLELIRVRHENERLVVEQERNRFARDLHDILGHSLTVITVKTELAQRLLDIDIERTRAELADLEMLSRESLADVRRAVQGYREISLPGEIARARLALTAAGIEHVLPNSTDDVPAEHRELFAWTIREGVTNVIRHSGAETCTVGLSVDRVSVVDDGRGPNGSAPAGHGLSGLHERAAALGARVAAGRAGSAGFRLEVEVP